MPKDANVRTAAAAEPKEEIFEVTLPEGVELDSLPEPEPEPAVEKKPDLKVVKTEKTDKPEEPAAKKDTLPPSTREERRKRKQYADLYEKTAAERDALEAELNRRKAEAAGRTSQSVSKERRAELVDRGNKADTMGGLIEIVLDELDHRDQNIGAALNEERFNRHLQVSETIAKNFVNREHGSPVYDLLLREAGITDALKLKPGSTEFNDPLIARAIYESRDPGMAAYQLAMGKLEKEGRLDTVLAKAKPVVEDDAEGTEVDPEPVKKPAPKAETTAAEARRAGAREVIEKVGATSSRPRGLDAIKPASPPKRGVTKTDVDAMSDKDRNALFKANPTLRDWWLGGVENP